MGGRLFLGSLACIGGLWAWSNYVSTRQSPSSNRKALLAVEMVATFGELGLCCAGYLFWWMFPLVAITNAWGPLDAVLRSPVVHDLDTFFTVKQVFLLCIKLVSLPFGLADLLENLNLLVALSSVNFA